MKKMIYIWGLFCFVFSSWPLHVWAKKKRHFRVHRHSRHHRGRFLAKLPWQWGKCRLCRRRLYRMSRRDVDRLLSYAHHHFSYIKRLELFSEMFLGARYRYGPLGEGPRGRYDRDPLFRLDRVDCLTYVETVMALALSPSLRKAKKILQKIRYKNGIIRYDHRNHFTATQWLVENSRTLPLLKEITRKVGGKYVAIYSQKVSSRFWRYSYWGRRLPPVLRPKSYKIAYIPLKYIARIEKKLPDFGWMGEIFDKPEHPSSIRHVGFFHRKNGRIYFRHANIGKRGVRDELLGAYVRWRQRYYTASPKSPYHILGFTFWQFLKP